MFRLPSSCYNGDKQLRHTGKRGGFMEFPKGCYAAMVAALSHMTGVEIAEELEARQEAPSGSEYRSWCNSIPILVDVIHRAGLDELTLVLEYQTPIGSRIDAVLLGEGKTTGKPLVLVIELKQWSAIEEHTEGRESSVSICLSRAENRFEERIHPVQQTLTYAKHLRMNHSNVTDGKMDVRCCQFLMWRWSKNRYKVLRPDSYNPAWPNRMFPWPAGSALRQSPAASASRRPAFRCGGSRRPPAENFHDFERRGHPPPHRYTCRLHLRHAPERSHRNGAGIASKK